MDGMTLVLPPTSIGSCESVVTAMSHSRSEPLNTFYISKIYDNNFVAKKFFPCKNYDGFDKNRSHGLFSMYLENELLDGRILTRGRGSQFIVRLDDGREINAIPLLEALEKAEFPAASLFNRRVQVCMHSHPKLPRIVWVGRPKP